MRALSLDLAAALHSLLACLFFADIDGAHFGPTFPPLFFLTFEQLWPKQPVTKYIPKVFGFRIHKYSVEAEVPGPSAAIHLPPSTFASASASADLLDARDGAGSKLLSTELQLASPAPGIHTH